jgi:penicillin-binding protein 1B
LSLVFAVYVALLDQQVRSKFSGKRWAVPARVYGRPMELYPGAEISTAQLASELTRLGYRKVSYPKHPASWSMNKNRFLVYTRPFRFWDSEEPSLLAEIVFNNGVIAALKHKDSDLPLMRLEAPEIGSIYPAHNEDRVLVSREELPDTLVAALFAVEDRAFYSHYGVDPRAILRAGWSNIQARGVVQGGSTLTQQLVKNFYLTRERSLWRKFNEAIMAVLLEIHFSKDQILEGYANEIYLGQDGQRAIHGFGLASHFYFNQPLQELDLPKLALLVGLVKGPSYYDPRRHPERALARRNLVIDLLQEQQLISDSQAKEAKSAKLAVNERKGIGQGRYPAFIDLVRRQLHRDYREEDLTSEGLRIFTTLDPWMQDQASMAVTGRLSQLEKSHKFQQDSLQAAAVLVGPQNGEVLALVGDRNPAYAGFNRALDAVRPIGSLIKPVVYLAALMQPQRYTLISRLEDRSITLKEPNGKKWTPGNYDNQEHGEVLLHKALAHSYNLATVRLGLDIGLDEIVDLLRQLGISRPIDQVPALLLGAVSLSPLEVAQLYQTFAANGYYSPLRAIREVLSSSDEPLQRYPLTVRQSVEPGPLYLLNRNLQEVVRQGTGQRLASFVAPEMNIAGKTGTTNNLRDSWFAGFSGDKVAVVWVGRDDNQSAGLTGSSGALLVWGDMMKRLGVMPLGLMKPESVVTEWIEPASGLKADENCSQARQYPFIQGSAPTVEASCVGSSNGALQRLFRSFFE